MKLKYWRSTLGFHASLVRRCGEKDRRRKKKNGDHVSDPPSTFTCRGCMSGTIRGLESERKRQSADMTTDQRIRRDLWPWCATNLNNNQKTIKKLLTWKINSVNAGFVSVHINLHWFMARSSQTLSLLATVCSLHEATSSRSLPFYAHEGAHETFASDSKANLHLGSSLVSFDLCSLNQ